MPSLNDSHTTMFSYGNCVDVVVIQAYLHLAGAPGNCDSGDLQVQCRVDKAVYMCKCDNLLIDTNNSITAD